MGIVSNHEQRRKNGTPQVDELFCRQKFEFGEKAKRRTFNFRIFKKMRRNKLTNTSAGAREQWGMRATSCYVHTTLIPSPRPTCTVARQKLFGMVVVHSSAVRLATAGGGMVPVACCSRSPSVSFFSVPVFVVPGRFD